MKLSIFSLAIMVGVAMSAATPNGSKGKGPPGPPSGTYGGISQTCTASQSSIHCCNTSGNKVGSGNGKKKHVSYDGGDALLVCSQINEKENNKPVSAICSTTVACCIGDGCIAIAN